MRTFPLSFSSLLRFISLLSIAASFTITAPAQDLKERDQIADKYKWNLSDIYKSDQAWENDVAAIEKMIPSVKAFEGRISKSADDLLAFYKLSEQINKKIENALVYAGMSFDQDTRNQKYTGYRDRISTISSQYSEATSWFTPELVSIPDATFEAWFKANSELAVYKHSIDDALRTRAHTLSPAEERIIALSGKVSGAPSRANAALRNTDIIFPTVQDENGNEVQLSEGRMRMLLESPDPRVRRDASFGMLNTYKQFENTAAALMTGNIDGDIYYARARNYNSCLHSSLDNDNIDTTVFLNLVATVKKHADVIQRYADLRRRALGLDSIHFYDMSAPLVEESREEISYDDAVKTIQTAMAPLGTDYNEAMMAGFNGGWVDVYETKAKRSGAYSWSSYESHPYMLLNYNNTMDDMFTTAHEMGHCMHTWHSKKNQPYVYSGYTLFNAEIASTLNEALLMDYLLKNEKDPDKRLKLINQYIDNIRGTVITQVMFADFELKMHRAGEAGEPLTAESLSDMYMETMLSYYGNSVVADREYASTWIRIPHFYRNFYVYKYATSFCASEAIAQKILKGEKGAREAMIRYLSSGSSKYPLELVKDAGVDLSSPAPIEATMQKLASLVDEMEKLLKQTKRI